MKRIFIALAAVGLTACSSGNGHFDASGTFEATEVIVSSEVSGRIMRLDVAEGQLVTAGVELGYIDSTQLYLQRMQLISSLKSIGSRRQDISTQIAATQEQIATQIRERSRTEQLIAANAANRKQLDDINSMIAVLEKQLAAQRSTLENNNRGVTDESSAMDVQIAQIEDQLAKSRIVSPITGTVLVKYAETGEVTAPGKPLFKVADTENMLLRAYITSGQLTELKIGQRVSVFADQGDKGSRQYEGTVSWISDKSEFTPKTIQTRDERANLVYAIKIAVDNRDGLIKIGMYADVKFDGTVYID